MEKIIDCEHAYSKAYCRVYENDDVIRFSDPSLPEMRDHNYTYIKDKNALEKLIENEIEVATRKRQDFLKVVLDTEDHLELPNLPITYRVDKIGYYCFDISHAGNIKSEKKAMIKKVDHPNMIEDIVFCDLEFDGDFSRKEFHTKKNKRRGDVYLADSELDAYVCYEGANVVGICDLFLHNSVAKIENFLVIPSHQRKGYGTYILKSMIDIALENGAKEVYLTTDEDDTAKEMYEKLYFSKVGTRAEIVFDLTDKNYSTAELDFRLAALSDGKAIKKMYAEIVEHMLQNRLEIWDDIYPIQCIEDDIANDRFYIMTAGNDIVSGASLSKRHNGETAVHWKNPNARAMYMDRLGVAVNQLHKGIASQMIQKIREFAKTQKIEYVRLFVVSSNIPAMRLYEKNNFVKVEGVYKEVVDDELTLIQYGYELEV